MYHGRRYARQRTKGTHHPHFYATEEYKQYVRSLPPQDQYDYIQPVIDQWNTKTRSYYRKHYPTSPTAGQLHTYDASSFFSNMPAYNPMTHRPKYYN